MAVDFGSADAPFARCVMLDPEASPQLLLFQVCHYLRSEYAAAQETFNEQCGPHQLRGNKFSCQAT